MSIQVISQSKDGRRAQIVVHGVDNEGKRTSKTRHVVVRGTQYEYATTVTTLTSEGPKTREVVQEVYEVGS